MRKLYAVFTTSTLYLLLATLFCVFELHHAIDKLMYEDSLAGTKVYFIIIGSLVCFGIACGIIGIIASIVCLVRGDDALAVAKTAMIVKLCLVPAYLVLFCYGTILGIMIFTYVFAFIIIVADYFVLLITGFFNSVAVIRAIKDGRMTFKESWWYILLQFVYCADVVASVLLYHKLKKLYAEDVVPAIEE